MKRDAARGTEVIVTLWSGLLRETVLVVNSQAAERAALSDFFTHANCSVLVAASSEQALEICRSFEGAIHILVIGIDGETNSGWGLAEKASRLRPGLIVLFLSSEALNQDGGDTFAKRPLSPPHIAFDNKALMEITSALGARARAACLRN